jgi:hypothetical protein
MNNLNIARLNIGSGGGGRSPAAPSEIVQSLRSTTDGEFVTDSVGVLDEPRYTGIPCLAFDGSSTHVVMPTTIPSRDKFVVEASIVLRSDFSFTLCGGGTSTTGLGCMGFESSGAPRFALRIANAAKDNYVQYLTGGLPQFAYLYDNEYHTVRFELVTSTSAVLITIDGITVGSGSLPGAATADAVCTWIGRHNMGAIGQLYNRATMAWIKFYADDVLLRHYNFEESSGLTCYNVVANANHGTISTGDLTTMRAARRNVGTSWNALKGFRLATVGAYDNVQIPALASGASAANGAALTNPGGFVHNGGIYGVKQVDPLFYKGPIVVSGTGTDADGTWEYFCEFEGRGEWHLTGSPSAVLSAQGSSWVIEDTGFYFAIASTAPLPPKTGWGADETGDGLAPILTYDAGFYAADDGTFASKSYADYLAHYEASNGADNLWVKLLSPTVLQADQYNFAKVFTTSETNRNLAYYGGAL